MGNFLQISDYSQSGVIAHNTSEFKDAVHLSIDSNYNPDIPINIVSTTENLKANDIIFPRFYIHAKSKSNSRIFIRHINHNTRGAGNAVSEFYCEESSSIDIIHVSNIKNQKFIDSISAFIKLIFFILSLSNILSNILSILGILSKISLSKISETIPIPLWCDIWSKGGGS